jgi:DNA-binding FrmR family transcriptional regulator
MDDRDGRVIRAAESAVKFLAELESPSRERKLPSSRIVKATKRLEQAVEAARAAEGNQNHARVILGAPGSSLRRTKMILLKQHLDPIAADGLEMLTGLPGIKETLRLPRVKDAPAKHLEAAERVRRVAEVHEQEFISQYEYSEDFLEQFDAAVENLKAADGLDRGLARANYSRATAAVKSEIAAVRRALDRLHTRIVAEYLDDKKTIEHWRETSRVPATKGRPTKRRAANKLARRAREEQERAHGASDSK